MPRRTPGLAWLLRRVALVVTLVLVLMTVIGQGSDPALVRVADITTGVIGTVSSTDGPVVGAAVELRPSGAASSSAPLLSGSTDSAGAYQLAAADGTYDLSIRPPAGSGLRAFVRASVRVLDGRSTVVDAVLLTPGVRVVRVQGVVRNGEGAPEASVQVRLLGGESDAVATSDADGHYSTSVVPGTYHVQVEGFGTPTSPGFFLSDRGPAVVLSGDRTLDLTLPGGVQTFHVQDVNGTPLSGARVNLTSDVALAAPLAPDLTFNISRWSTYGEFTDFAGNVTLPVFPTTAHATILPRTGRGAASTSIRFSPTPGGTLVLTAPPGATVQGVVRNGAGTPVDSYAVQVSLLGVDSVVAVYTDRNGRYSTTVVPGDYTVEVLGNGGTTSPIFFPSVFSTVRTKLTVSGNRTLDLTLPGGMQTFHVQDGNGAAVPNAQVQVIGDDVPPYFNAVSLAPGVLVQIPTNWTSRTRSTDEFGNVTLPVFRNDAHVIVTPPSRLGLANARTGFRPVPGGTLTVIAPRSATVRGVVRNADGSPVGAVRVHLFGGTSDVAVESDSSGHYSASVVPGDYSLEVQRLASRETPSIDTVRSAALPIRGDQVLDLTLPHGIQTFHLQDDNGSPIANAQVQVDGVRGPTLTATLAPGISADLDSGWSTPAAITDSSGDVRLPVFPGRARLTIALPAGSDLADTRIDFTGTPGGTFSIGFGDTLPQLAPVDTTLSVSPTGGAPNQEVTMTCAPPSNAPTADGTARFLDGSQLLGTAPVTDGSAAVLRTTALGAGPHALSCVFVDSETSASSTSNTVTAAYGTAAGPGADEQTVTVTVPQGALTISTPYTPSSPLRLGTAVLDQSDSTYSASAPFGTAEDGYIVITDTRAGDVGWTASVVAGPFTSATSSFPGAHAGLTGVTAVQVPGNALPATAVVEIDTVAFAPGLGIPRQFAILPEGVATGSVNLTALLSIDQVPTSVTPGLYTATATFTAM